MSKNRFIYALNCPFTGRTHYIGKTKVGLVRPESHFKESHSKKINEWVDNLSMLGQKPDIEILEYLTEEDDVLLDRRETIWISKYLDKGYVLLNEAKVKPITIRPDLQMRLNEVAEEDYKSIGRFVAERRKMVGLTQEEFAQKMGVGLPAVRKLEQGKKNLSFNLVLEMLSAFGCTLGVVKMEKK